MTDDLRPRHDLLPGDATPLERAIADTEGRLDDVDTDLIRRSKVVGVGHNGGPALAEDERAPADFLPFLAWERSVDVWDPAWPDEVKRAVIDAAPTVHRYKGTRYAVATALAALQVDARIVEWWQELPRAPPYTFKVTAYARARLYDGALLDARLIRIVLATVMRTKPLSRAFSLAVGAAFPGRLGAAAVASVRSRTRAALAARFHLRPTAGIGLAGVAVARIKVRSLMLVEAP